MTTKSKKILSRFTAKYKESDHLLAATEKAMDLKNTVAKMDQCAIKELEKAKKEADKANMALEKANNEAAQAKKEAAQADKLLEEAKKKAARNKQISNIVETLEDAINEAVDSAKDDVSESLLEGGVAVDESEGAFMLNDFSEGGAVDGKENECNV